MWGTLAFEAKGARRSAAFACADSWLENPDRFALSPDLPLAAGHQFRANKDLNQSAYLVVLPTLNPMAGGAWLLNATTPNNAKNPAATDLRLVC